jgi:hypothetical protein
MADNRIFVIYPKNTPPNLVSLLRTSANEAEKKAAESKSYTSSQFLSTVKSTLLNRARALQLNIRVMIMEEATASSGEIAERFGRVSSTETYFVMPFPSFKAVQDPSSFGGGKGISKNQKLIIIGAVGGIIALVVVYFVYKTYFAKSP